VPLTCVYLVSEALFNNVTTSAGTPIDNSQPAAIGAIFPFNHALPNGQVVQVTVAKSDDAWDDHYVGGSRLSSSTFAKNCYGFAFDKSFWVPTPNSKNAILADEWYPGDLGSDTIVPSLFDLNSLGHMVAVAMFCLTNECYGDICWGYMPCETREKNQSSGVYKYVYLCPIGSGSLGAFYRQAP
jgi:hypothetical protein